MKPIELNKETFAGYGDVLNDATYDKKAAAADNDEISYWKRIGAFDAEGSLSSGIMIAHDRAREYRTLERHKATPEVLVALDSDAIVVAAKPAPEGKGVVDPALFAMKRGQAIVFHPSVWHYAPFPVGAKDATFLVLFAEGTEDHDMDFINLSETLIVEA
jgi:ureidoglycolate hydrolase